MSIPTINTPQVRPVPYVLSSMPSLDGLQRRIAPVAGVTFGAAASTWLVGDQAAGSIAFVAGLAATVGTVAIAAAPLVAILNDARDGHAPRDLAPVVAAVLAALATAIWSGLWIQAAVLVLGTGIVAAQLVALVRAARIQLGKEWDR